MRLKSIKLAGFKSFVDPTTVSLPSNMCAVVGPNGCGKSNVIDAVRWVMGESSAKNLRGESMTDVIFNGSVNRQPVGQASIELVFDNSDGGVGGEYASYAEISTRRLVTREGQSEYFLNGTRCRRRDITDIFLGTGLGPRSYAIIEQGMISRLIESKPEELRVFIEEAAGISKYKERRRETESRMRRTLENLERLTDLRDELERQLQHLQRQAQAAEKYREYRAEERRLKAELQALEWRKLTEQLQDSAHRVGELEVQLEAVLAEHQQLATAIEQHRQTQVERSDVLNEVQGRYYALGAEVSRIEQSIQHQQERSRQLREDRAQTAINLEQALSHLAEDRTRLEAWEEELAALVPESELLAAKDEESAEALAVAEEGMQTWQQRWDEFNQRAAEPRQRAEVQQSRIQHLEHALKRLQSRVEQLAAEQQNLAPQEGDDDPGLMREELAEAELIIGEYEEQAETLAESVAQTREQSTAQASQLDEARSELQQLRGRCASLEALQQAAVEDSSDGFSAWLSRNGLQDAPRLLSRMTVEDAWQPAVETVLGNYLQAVCVDSIQSLAGATAGFEQGSLALVESGDDRAGPAGSLASRVSSSGWLGSLLLHVRTAADADAAHAMRGSLAAHESVITPDGLWMGANWLSLSRGDDPASGVLRRQQELETLTASIDALEARARSLTEGLASQEEALRLVETQRQDVQRELQAATRRSADIAARLKAQEARQEQIQARRDGIARDINDARAQFAAEQASLAEARQILAEAIEQLEADSGERETLLSARDTTRTQLDHARQQARHDRDAANQAAMRRRGLQTQIETIRSSIDRTEAQVAQLSERQAQLDAGLGESESPVQALREELERQLELRLASEADLGTARQQVTEVEHQLRESEQQRAAIEQRAASARATLEQERLQRQTLQVQQQVVERQLGELERTPQEVLESTPTDASSDLWQQQLEKVAARIVRLGSINLAAIDEYSQQSERKQYLDAQNEDLVSALDTLESAIRKIDRETRSRFQDTFEKVNAGLQDLFPRVFGGGSASLEMTGDDLLDTGISIMARPPGKKNSTIHLLSGGEKALTAIALVFSIFQLNPAPFCMLDEVDAPLDDANTGRYARMVKEMSDKVQFIFITHNKITMEMADQLLGVTMHEPGVSRLVSVDVEEAAELAAS
ncbi:chromosome segregation protein SMC [Chromatocurvus halotolerans]|uniref:Chromosome partition protein Smc n=1 Tax=Chromatocurvus halotolerans TaxID=1132028 RepID=A0A4R2KVF7_9GAMM|nr:chromosome segregation protein SMC [Chromatocurvus halotolerans]TCO77803.1 condensin subunit Smc [Chromatocurvus halotolerans]